MKFQYIGDDNEPPQKIEFMSLYEFELNGPYVDVSEEEIIKKLKGNKCFKRLTRDTSKKQPQVKVTLSDGDTSGNKEASANQVGHWGEKSNSNE